MNLDRKQFDSINRFLLIRFDDDGKPIIYQELSEEEKIVVYNAIKKEMKNNSKSKISTSDTFINNVAYYWDLSKKTINNGIQSFRKTFDNIDVNAELNSQSFNTAQLEQQCDNDKTCESCAENNINNDNDIDTDAYDNMMTEMLMQELNEYDDILKRYSEKKNIKMQKNDNIRKSMNNVKPKIEKNQYNEPINHMSTKKSQNIINPTKERKLVMQFS